MKISKSEYGFSTVELVIVLLVIVVLGVGGWYVYNSQKSQPTTNESATKTADTANEQVTPQAFVESFVKDYRAGNKKKVDTEVTHALVAASGKTKSSFYELCKMPSSGCGYILDYLDFKKAKVTVKEYTAKNGAKGKTVDYTTTIASGGSNAGGSTSATSKSVSYFSLIPKANSWLLDDFGVSSDANANISTN